VDQRLVACKAIIAGDETPANQAIARCNRSIAYNMKGDVDLAMADLTEALRLGLGEYRGLICNICIKAIQTPQLDTLIKRSIWI
jgi:hypothetical protein